MSATYLHRIMLAVVVGIGIFLLQVSRLRAQENEASETAEPVAADSAAGPAAEAFQSVMTEWKDRLKQLRDIRAEYAVGEEKELAGIGDRFEAKVDEFEEFISAARKAGLAAYEEAPGEDRELTRFLIGMLQDEAARDNFEDVNELASVLIKNGCNEKGVKNYAGIAAFALGDFESAQQHLRDADIKGTISDQGAHFMGYLSDLDLLKSQWEEELALREAEAEADDLPRVKLTTDQGDIVVELFENEAPETVGNFVSLVEKGFYDGLSFHRVIKGFMAQAGCPNGDGTGGPGYNIYCECVNDNHRKHFRGSLSMAKTAARNTGGSQFYVCYVPTVHLNGQHTVFGRVVEGLDVASDIPARDPQEQTGDAVKIVKAEVIRKREHEYAPNKVQ